MPKKIKKRKTAPEEEDIRLLDLAPETIDMECPYHETMQASLDTFDVFDLDDEVEYLCSCERDSYQRECKKIIKFHNLRPDAKIEVRDAAPDGGELSGDNEQSQ